MPDLTTAWAEVGDASALIVSGNFERASCAGRVFFEDERDVFAGKLLDFLAFFLIRFELRGKLQQSVDFGRGKIEQFQKMFLVKR